MHLKRKAYGRFTSKITSEDDQTHKPQRCCVHPGVLYRSVNDVISNRIITIKSMDANDRRGCCVPCESLQDSHLAMPSKLVAVKRTCCVKSPRCPVASE